MQKSKSVYSSKIVETIWRTLVIYEEIYKKYYSMQHSQRKEMQHKIDYTYGRAVYKEPVMFLALMKCHKCMLYNLVLAVFADDTWHVI